jgi:outer membrane protein, heavy metal efflux system
MRFSTLLFCLIGATSPIYSQAAFSLSQAIRQARNNNIFLKTAFFNIAAAESDVVTAGLRPNLNLNNQTLLLLRPAAFAENTGWLNRKNTQVWWQLTKPILMPAFRQYRLEYASRLAALENKRYADLERNVSLDIAGRWLEVWNAHTRLDLLSQAQANVDTLVRINENRLKNLVITRNDLLRTQLLSEQYTLQIRSLQQNYRLALQNLKVVLGTADTVAVETIAPIETLPLPAGLDSLVRRALLNRTDIQLATGNVEASGSYINLQKAVVLPRPELGIIWNPQNGVPYMGFFGTVSLPIFDRNQGERQRARVLQAQAQQNLQAVQWQVRNEVQTAYQAYQARKQGLELYRNVLQKSDQVLNTVRYAYLRGGTTVIDFLEAQRTWFETRQAYNEALLGYYQAYIQLLFATGLITDV